MYVGVYKSVNSGIEFYSKVRDSLNFPTQVEYRKERYLLNKTIQVASESQLKNVFASAKTFGINFNVEID